MTARPFATHWLTPSRESSMPRPSTPRVSASNRSNSPSPQPTSRTFAPAVTISATSRRSTRAPPGLRAASAMVRSWFARVSISVPGLRRRCRHYVVQPCPCGNKEPLRRSSAPSSPPSGGEAACPRGTLQKTTDNGEQFRLLQQECIMPLVAHNLGERHPRATRIQRMHNGAGIGGRKQPVRGKRDHAKSGWGILECIGQAPVVVCGKIEIVHRPGKIQVGVGIEPLDEADPLVAQIALDLEVGVKGESRVVAVLETAPELAVEGHVRKVSDMRAHASNSQPAPSLGVMGALSVL